MDRTTLALGAAGLGAVLWAGGALGSDGGIEQFTFPELPEALSDSGSSDSSSSSGSGDTSGSGSGDGLTAEDLASADWTYGDDGEQVVMGSGTEDDPYQSLFDDRVEEQTGVDVESDYEAPGGLVSTIEEDFNPI